ncbi:MAG: sigma 54-dependent transcriptional regulator, partial [Pseudomonadota bacterium]
GRVTRALDDKDIAPRATVGAEAAPDADARLVAQHLGPRAAAIDLFDRAQLAAVLRVCARSATLSEAGRTLFAASRAQKTSRNDADRLRKYLDRFGLSWADIAGRR